MKTVSILGSTGSIGIQALQVCKEHGIMVSAIAANTNVKLLEAQARQFNPSLVVCYNEAAARKLRLALSDTDIEVDTGLSGLIRVATMQNTDILLTAVVGMIGLIPTLAAIDAKIDIALANKETLVCAGEIVMNRAREMGVSIYPVDSEHSAIFQCIQGNNNSYIKRVILTASGGPFFGYNKDELSRVTKQMALKHPNWSMGSKISIDSATMMNKGLELIEAMWLFNLAPSDIDILVHRQSIVHSMVEFCDNSIIAQLGPTDMRLPIQYALTYPLKYSSSIPSLDFLSISALTFDKPDYDVFTALNLAKTAAEVGGNMGCVLNAANEQAVMLFLNDKISFNDICSFVCRAMDEFSIKKDINLEYILECDIAVREFVLELSERG